MKAKVPTIFQSECADTRIFERKSLAHELRRRDDSAGCARPIEFMTLIDCYAHLAHITSFAKRQCAELNG
jgi:hypothetical protein